MYVQVHHAGSFFSFFPFPHISYSVLTLHTYVKRAAAKKKKKKKTDDASIRKVPRAELLRWPGSFIFMGSDRY